MNRVGIPFRFSFIIRVVFGIRLEAEDLLVSNADHGHAPGAYHNDVSKDIGGASLVESFDARSDVFDYYDHAEELTFNTWQSTNFNHTQTITFLTCESESLESMGSGVNSSSSITLAVTASVHAETTNAQIRVNHTGAFRSLADNSRRTSSIPLLAVYAYHLHQTRRRGHTSLESMGSATLSVSVAFTASISQSYEKTWVYPAYHVGIFAVYFNVGLKFTLEMTGSITFRALVPVQWNICTTPTGVCSDFNNTVTAQEATFVADGQASITGIAEVSTSLQFEAALILTASVQVTSSMTLRADHHRTISCHLHSTIAFQLSTLTTLQHLANAVGSRFSWALGSCFSGFSEINISHSNSHDIINRACPIP